MSVGSITFTGGGPNGSVPVNATSTAPTTVTLTNNSTAHDSASGILNLAISGPNAADFKISTAGCVAVNGANGLPITGEYADTNADAQAGIGLAAGSAGCTVGVQFAPKGTTVGAETATLTVIATPGTPGAGTTLGLRATSTSMLTFVTSVAPGTSFDYKTELIDKTTVTLTNNSASTSTQITNTVLSDTTDFVITEDDCIGNTLIGGGAAHACALGAFTAGACSSCQIQVYDNTCNNAGCTSGTAASTTVTETATVGGSPPAVTLDYQ